MPCIVLDFHKEIAEPVIQDHVCLIFRSASQAVNDNVNIQVFRILSGTKLTSGGKFSVALQSIAFRLGVRENSRNGGVPLVIGDRKFRMFNGSKTDSGRNLSSAFFADSMSALIMMFRAALYIWTGSVLSRLLILKN